MNMNKLKMSTVIVAAVLAASCGGGGDISGDVAEMSLTPDEVKYGPTPNCASVAGESFWVTINGGQSPFRIQNTFPSFMQVDRTEVTGKDPRFKITMLGQCGENLTVAVFDYFSRQANIEVSVEFEDPDED
jgi:hypothetical protein